MKKITFLMLHLNYGGIEKQVTTLANNLCDKYDIEILSLYNILGHSFYNLDTRIKVKYILPYGPNKKDIIDNLKKFKFISFLKEINKSVKILYNKYIKIGKIIKNLDCDILVSSRIEFSKQIKRNDILVISQEHSYNNTNKYISKVKKSFKNVDCLVVMTKKAEENYKKWLNTANLKTKVVTIPNITDEVSKYSKLDKKQIISIGRLEEVKDFPMLIDVFKIVHERHPDWKLKICGEGSKRKEIEEKIKENNIEEFVILTGRIKIEDLNREILNSSISILTSKSESFSLAITSCMSMGVPCVSFDIDVGPREIIEDGYNGYIVKSRNSTSMALKVCKLIEDEKLRKEFSKEAIMSSKKYFPINIVKKWEDIFENNIKV